MTLFIDTSLAEIISLALHLKNGVVYTKKLKAAQRQGERLIPALHKLLLDKKLSLEDIKKIVVVNQGGSFTSLRIGVITANALAYALNIPVEPAGSKKSFAKEIKKFNGHNIVMPRYSADPEIYQLKKMVA